MKRLLRAGGKATNCLNDYNDYMWPKPRTRMHVHDDGQIAYHIEFEYIHCMRSCRNDNSAVRMLLG